HRISRATGAAGRTELAPPVGVRLAYVLSPFVPAQAETQGNVFGAGDSGSPLSRGRTERMSLSLDRERLDLDSRAQRQSARREGAAGRIGLGGAFAADVVE